MLRGGSPTNIFARAYRVVCEVEESLARFLLTATLLVVVYAAFTRYLGYPVAWGMEFASFLFAWAVFFAADVAMRNDRHAAVELLVNRLPERARNVVKLINYSLILVFLAVLLVYGSSLTWTTRFRAYSGIPGFSYAWATLSVPVGSLLLIISTSMKARDAWRALRAGKAAAGTEPASPTQDGGGVEA